MEFLKIDDNHGRLRCVACLTADPPLDYSFAVPVESAIDVARSSGALEHLRSHVAITIYTGCCNKDSDLPGHTIIVPEVSPRTFVAACPHLPHGVELVLDSSCGEALRSESAGGKPGKGGS